MPLLDPGMMSKSSELVPLIHCQALKDTTFSEGFEEFSTAASSGATDVIVAWSGSLGRCPLLIEDEVRCAVSGRGLILNLRGDAAVYLQLAFAACDLAMADWSSTSRRDCARLVVMMKVCCGMAMSTHLTGQDCVLGALIDQKVTKSGFTSSYSALLASRSCESCCCSR
jgi:hypothetical protein